MDLYESSFRGAVLADINNDDTLDVIFASSEGKLYALNGSRGNLLWSINLTADYGDSLYSLEQGPLVASFKGDDTLDIFVAGGYSDYPNIQNDFGRAYAIKVGIGKGPDWTMFQHDQYRSNCLCTPKSIPTGNEQLPTAAEVKAFPNPFAQDVYFNVSLTSTSHLSAIIYNEQGVAVKTLSAAEQQAGDYNYTWNGTDASGHELSAGLYFCKISAGHSFVIKKIVLIR